MSKPIIALMYDFDRTLALEDMQNFSFIPKLGFTPEEFWKLTEEFCKKYDMDKILGYLYTMIKYSKEKGIKLDRNFLQECGKNIRFFDGVTTWFNRINEYAASKGLQCEHYLITSFKEFKQVFGSEYLYDAQGNAFWPRTTVNYTLKTQYIFRISKGVINTNDDKEINEKTPHRRIIYQNMIYMGDGLTDVPCMILVKENGGYSIAVYPKGSQEKVAHLEKVVKLIIDSISIRETLELKREKTEKQL